MAHRLVKPPPIHLGLQFYLVSSQRKEGKKKGALFTKSHVCFDCPQKRSANRRIAQRKRIYNQNKRHQKRRVPKMLLNLHSTGVWNTLCDCAHLWLSYLLFVGVHCQLETVLSCVASSWRQLLRMMGSGWASVLKTQSSSGRRSSSENSK